jgi:hypothetical protein
MPSLRGPTTRCRLTRRRLGKQLRKIRTTHQARSVLAAVRIVFGGYPPDGCCVAVGPVVPPTSHS